MPVSVPRLIRTPSVPPAPGRSAGFIVFHPRYERFLRRCGLDAPADVLDLPGEVVCGHPDRHVARVVLATGTARRVVYLKREHAVGLRARFSNALAGFGWVSRSEREAETLRGLEAAGLPGPQWLAYGADGAGRAFLLVDELANAADLRRVLGDSQLSAADRRALAERAGRSIADLHDAGFGTPELAAKHLFVNPDSLAVTLLDWQSAGRPGPVPDFDRARQLAGLHATVAADLADRRARLRFLWAYLRVVRRGRVGTGRPPLRFGQFARTVQANADRLRDRSSVRDQRSVGPARRLVWLAGEAVCVVPELVPFWPTPATAAPFYPDPREVALPTRQEWVTFPDGRRALLTRFRTVDPVGRFLAAVREKPWRSPAARAARVLFHLDRHGISGPKLLAFGQRTTGPAAAESFVLSEPPAGGVPVAARLAQCPLAERRELLRGCGRLLRALHDAGCRPERSAESPPVVVTGGRLAIDSPAAVALTRRGSGMARRTDLRWFVGTALGPLTRADRCRVVRGYCGVSPDARTVLASLL